MAALNGSCVKLSAKLASYNGLSEFLPFGADWDLRTHVHIEIGAQLDPPRRENIFGSFTRTHVYALIGGYAKVTGTCSVWCSVSCNNTMGSVQRAEFCSLFFALNSLLSFRAFVLPCEIFSIFFTQREFEG
jgi:hypothetical protein